MVKGKNWMDAKEFYSKAIAVLTNKQQGRYEKTDAAEAEEQEKRQLHEVVLTNRALCNLELSVHDTRSVEASLTLSS